MKLIRIIDYIIIKTINIFPVNKSMIVFNSCPDYSDNARVFSDYLIQNNLTKKLKIVWLVKDPTRYNNNNISFVESSKDGILLKRDYYIARARFVVFTHRSPIRTWPKKQMFIHTTHSASQLKASLGHNEKARVVMKKADFHLACGMEGIKKKSAGHGYSLDSFITIGMPRLDLLFKHRDCIGVLFPEMNNHKMIFALETFKQSERFNDGDRTVSYGLNIIQSFDELYQLNAYLKTERVLLVIKPHPLQVLDYVSTANLSNIRFLTDEKLKENDILLYELIENADGLITDYSSVFYDYLFLNRPIGFTLGDISDYKRGFIDDDPLEEMVGEKIRTLDDLKMFVKHIITNVDTYEQDRISLRNRIFKYQDNKNCERLLEFLIKNGLAC